MDNNMSENNHKGKHSKKLKRGVQIAADEVNRQLHAHNRLMKRYLFRVVRRHNPDFSILYDILSQIVGDLTMKKNVIKSLITQALLLKRYGLVRAFVQYVKDLDEAEKQYRRFGKCMRCAEINIPKLPLCDCRRRKAG